MRYFLITLILTLSASAQTTAPLSEVAQRVSSTSTLTLPGNSPFHLTARIVETTNPDSTYKAEIEEYWVSEHKWRRTIKSPYLSQVAVMNGDKYSEQNDASSYYPSWLQTFVTALVDPLPMLDQLKHTTTQISLPNGSADSRACARFQSHTGKPEAQNSVFSVFCFIGKPVVLGSVTTPGYGVELKDYAPFGEQRIARRLVSYPEPGTTIEAKVTGLSKLTNIEDSLFVIDTPGAAADRLRTTQITQQDLESLLLETPALNWPSARDGKTSGVLSIYIRADRTGQVRETWPLNSDNPSLDDAIREQVMKWEYKRVMLDGGAVQFESILTFPFDIKVANPIPILSNDESRRLASHVVEADFPAGAAPKGTEVTIQIAVDAEGKIIGTSNPHNLDNALFFPAMNAARQWQFRPYLRDGKPDRFDAEITFHMR